MARIKTFSKSKKNKQITNTSQPDSSQDEKIDRNNAFSFVNLYPSHQNGFKKPINLTIPSYNSNSLPSFRYEEEDKESVNEKSASISIKKCNNTVRIYKPIEKLKIRREDDQRMKSEMNGIATKISLFKRTSKRLKKSLKDKLLKEISEESEEESIDYEDYEESININNEPKIPQSLIITLEQLLLRLFTSEKTKTNLHYLEDYEARILQSIIQRRTKESISLIHCVTNEKITTLFHRSPKKRCEEVYRFIMENSFKVLKSRFFDELNSKQRKKKVLKRSNDNKLFYSHYFSYVADQKQIDLSRFFLPFENSRAKFYPKKRGKTNININYIALLFESKIFKDDFLKYLNTDLRKDCIKATRHRIEVYIKKWRETLNQDYLNTRVIDTICEELQSEKKYFLPWSFKEIDSAIEEMKRTLVKYNLAC